MKTCLSDKIHFRRCTLEQSGKHSGVAAFLLALSVSAEREQHLPSPDKFDLVSAGICDSTPS
jgi:hypothetical protein